MKTKVNQIIAALLDLEAKGCHRVFFEYGNDGLCLRIFRGEESVRSISFERTITLSAEQSEVEQLCAYIVKLKHHVKSTRFQRCMRDLIKGVKARKWKFLGYDTVKRNIVHD